MRSGVGEWRPTYPMGDARRKQQGDSRQRGIHRRAQKVARNHRSGVERGADADLRQNMGRVGLAYHHVKPRDAQHEEAGTAKHAGDHARRAAGEQPGARQHASQNNAHQQHEARDKRRRHEPAGTPAAQQDETGQRHETRCRVHGKHKAKVGDKANRLLMHAQTATVEIRRSEAVEGKAHAHNSDAFRTTGHAHPLGNILVDNRTLRTEASRQLSLAVNSNPSHDAIATKPCDPADQNPSACRQSDSPIHLPRCKNHRDRVYALLQGTPSTGTKDAVQRTEARRAGRTSLPNVAKARIARNQALRASFGSERIDHGTQSTQFRKGHGTCRVHGSARRPGHRQRRAGRGD